MSDPIIDPELAMVVTIDYGDGTEPEPHVVSDGYTSVHLYDDEEKHTVTVEQVEVVPVEISTTVNGLTVTLDYEGTGIELGCEVFFGDGTGPHYIGPGAEEGPPYDYSYATAGTYTITVDPLGELFPLVSSDVTVSEDAPEAFQTESEPDDEDEDTPDVEVGYDPGAHTVTEVIGFVEDNPDELEDVIAAEEAGKARVTLISHLEGMRP